MEMLQQQYNLVKSSRQALFTFLETVNETEMNKPLPGFNNYSIARLHMHVINCYLYWIEDFTLQKQVKYFDEESPKRVGRLRSVFAVVDDAVTGFLQEFPNNELISRQFSDGSKEEYSILQIFTHCITHEFHHKGQMLSMCRSVGYTPVDTDVIRF